MADFDEEELSEEEEGDEIAAASPPVKKSWRSWLSGRTGWVLIAVLALLQAVFAFVMIMLKADDKPESDAQAQIQALAVEMLGREVGVKQINQMVAGPNGRRMTIGLDLVMVLGQLPEERIEGAPRPNDLEFDAFTAAIVDMEPRIRSRMNSLLQRITYDEYGSPDIYERIKTDIMNFVNDELDGLAFANVRPEIGKRRVTDVLLPMFVRQTM